MYVFTAHGRKAEKITMDITASITNAYNRETMDMVCICFFTFKLLIRFVSKTLIRASVDIYLQNKELFSAAVNIQHITTFFAGTFTALII